MCCDSVFCTASLLSTRHEIWDHRCPCHLLPISRDRRLNSTALTHMLWILLGTRLNTQIHTIGGNYKNQ